MPFTKDAVRRDPNINRKGRASGPAAIAALYRDLVVEFPEPAPHERVMLRSAASLFYRAAHCRVAAVQHRCIAEARKCIATLRTQRAAALAALPPPPREETEARIKRIIEGLPAA